MPYTWSHYTTGSTSLSFTLLDATYDIGNGSRPTPTTPLANGEFDELGSDRAPRRAQTVRIDEWYVDDDRTTRIKAWKAVNGTKGELWRTDDDTGEPQWTEARVREIPIRRGIDNAMQQDISLVFVLNNPIWYTNRHGAGWTLNATPLNYLNSGLSLNEANSTQTLTAGANSVVLANTGDEQVENVVVTVTAGSAAVTAVQFVSTETGIDFTWTGTLASGNDLVLDMGEQLVTNNGVGAYSGITRGAGYTVDAPLALPIPPGSTTTYTVTLTGGGTGTTILPEYYDGIS